MDSHQVIARFEAERQALALMDHPNIARVFDAGATETGTPYFVMELVKGVPLTKYCDEHLLTPKERLKLFIPVCQAIQHAHQKGIIHRDIKPSNVLVALYDGEPVPKVIDFGIAKATGQHLTEKTLVTGFGAVIGTLEYMSPEQAELNQLDIDTRSDIYSLGVLLYELLTGTTPLDRKRLKDATILEILRVIREEEAPKPSTRLSTMEDTPAVAANRGLEPKKLSGLVRGELDWIVMKALEKDRNRRYETANGLALDIQRYLADEPVQACPPSAWYRFRKLARRHRLALAMASVVTAALILLLAGLSAGVLLLNQERNEVRRQRDIAQENFQKALQAVDEYFTQVSESTLLKSQLPGLQPLRRQLLDTALKFYQGFAQQHRDDKSLQAELARASDRVARISDELGAKPEALAACRRAIELWEELRQEQPANAAYRHELAQCYGNLGYLQSRSGAEGEAALASLQKARALAEGLTRSYPDNPEYQKTLARAAADLGRWYQEHDSPQALTHFGDALKVWERLAKEEPELEIQVASLCMGLGLYHTMQGAVEEALACHGRARDIAEKWAQKKPTDSQVRRLLRYIYKNLGYVHDARTGQYDQARYYYTKVLELDEQFARENPAVFDYQVLWAGDVCQMSALIYDRTTDYDGAARLAQQALRHFERLDREYPHDPQVQKGLRLNSMLLGKAQAKAGHTEEAIRSLQRFRALLDQLEQDPAALAVEQPFDVAGYHANLGFAQKQIGQTAEALHSLERAAGLYRKLLEESPGYHALGALADTCCALGSLQRRAGRLAEAENCFKEVRTLLTKVSSPDSCDHYNQAVACAQLTLLAEEASKRALADEAIGALRRALAAGFPRVAELKTNPDLDPLRSRKDFQELLTGTGKRQ
jgi:tetratricopeptide (TPR) repeat protein